MLNGIITKLALNTDQNVNHGCNLKWKFGYRQADRIFTIEVWIGQTLSQSK